MTYTYYTYISPASESSTVSMTATGPILERRTGARSSCSGASCRLASCSGASIPSPVVEEELLMMSSLFLSLSLTRTLSYSALSMSCAFSRSFARDCMRISTVAESRSDGESWRGRTRLAVGLMLRMHGAVEGGKMVLSCVVGRDAWV